MKNKLFLPFKKLCNFLKDGKSFKLSPKAIFLFSAYRFSGFTLIEILISFSIISCLVVSVYSIFWSAIKIQHQSEILSRVYRELNLALDIISQDIEKIIFYQLQDGNSVDWSIQGDGDSLVFFISSQEGLKEVRYSLQKKEYGSVFTTVVGERYTKLRSMTLSHSEGLQEYMLVRYEKKIDDDFSEVTSTLETEILSSNIKEGGLRFFYAYKKKEDTKQFNVIWQDHLEKGSVPLGIRIQLTLIPLKGTAADPAFNKDFFFPVALVSQTLTPN